MKVNIIMEKKIEALATEMKIIASLLYLHDSIHKH
jgi:hypothetical protein